MVNNYFSEKEINQYIPAIQFVQKIYKLLKNIVVLCN